MTTVQSLNARIIRCTKCPRLVAHRQAVALPARRPRRFADWEYWARPLPGFGDPAARLFVLGLAPAAHGGNRTGRIFTGDTSGDWLYEALHRFGFANQALSRDRHDGLRLLRCYISAAVRCAPPDNKPALEEFDNCRPYLGEELQLLRQVRVVVALGRIAFEQYLKACRELGHPRVTLSPRFLHGAVHRLPWNVTLIASYHPSQQNTFTGKLTREMFHAVFRKARALLQK
jgi:uracil-DNA glycosylase family 4